jgi:hypothetical protein
MCVRARACGCVCVCVCVCVRVFCVYNFVFCTSVCVKIMWYVYNARIRLRKEVHMGAYLNSEHMLGVFVCLYVRRQKVGEKLRVCVSVHAKS